MEGLKHSLKSLGWWDLFFCDTYVSAIRIPSKL